MRRTAFHHRRDISAEAVVRITCPSRAQKGPLPATQTEGLLLAPLACGHHRMLMNLVKPKGNSSQTISQPRSCRRLSYGSCIRSLSLLSGLARTWKTGMWLGGVGGTVTCMRKGSGKGHRHEWVRHMLGEVTQWDSATVMKATHKHALLSLGGKGAEIAALSWPECAWPPSPASLRGGELVSSKTHPPTPKQ